MQLNLNYYLCYKFANALFTGLSLGTVITIYAPLEPSFFSLGGVFLAFGILIVSKLYDKLFSLEWFFKLNLFVEMVLLIIIGYFLYFKASYESAVFVYLGYQLSFLFGNYLVRMETLFIQDITIISKIDSIKQFGSLVGMGGAYLFYKLLKDKTNMEQIYTMHYMLFLLQFVVIILVYKSFKPNLYKK